MSSCGLVVHGTVFPLSSIHVVSFGGRVVWGFPAASKSERGCVVPGGLVSQSRIPSALTSSHGGVVSLSGGVVILSWVSHRTPSSHGGGVSSEHGFPLSSIHLVSFGGMVVPTCIAQQSDVVFAHRRNRGPLQPAFEQKGNTLHDVHLNMAKVTTRFQSSRSCRFRSSLSYCVSNRPTADFRSFSKDTA